MMPLDTPDNIHDVVRLLQEGRHSDCLLLIEQLHQKGIHGSGLSYIAAVCFIYQGRYHRCLDELSKECSRPGHPLEAAQLLAEIMEDTRRNPTMSQDLLPGRYIVSGLPPGNTGSGRFFSSLLPVGTKAGYVGLYPRPDTTFNRAEKIRLCSIRDSDVLVLHPQTLGYETMRSLFEAGNRVSMYVLDNSFFCMRSYNHRPDQPGECLDCLGNVRKCHSSCQPFPMPLNRTENLEFLEWLQSVAHQIPFFCQTKHQAELLTRHFGAHIQYQVIGMRTEEYGGKNGIKRFDIVFHGEALEAKGIRYALYLARELSEFSVLVPSAHEDVKRTCPDVEIPPNTTCCAYRWDTGLQDFVKLCSLVLCPSQWSAPVEGSLMKSLYYNGNVGVMETQFAFERELPSDLALRMSPDPKVAATQVREFLSTGRCDREKARQWVEQYNSRVQLERIFA